MGMKITAATKRAGVRDIPVPRHIINEIGHVYGALTVLRYAGSKVWGKSTKISVALWECECECGTICYRPGVHLRRGNTTSCGCKHWPGNRTTHGMSKTAEYRAWLAMKARCYNSHTRNFPQYGGRGIKVCDRWLGPNGFANFLADMGPKPSPQHTNDRIDVDGNYEPSNCRWADKRTQTANRRLSAKVQGKILEKNREIEELKARIAQLEQKAS